MEKSAVILVAESSNKDYLLIEESFQRAGVWNKVVRFSDGESLLDFLFQRGHGPQRQQGRSFLLVLDTNLDEVDGFSVLAQINGDPELGRMPVIVLSAGDKDKEIDKCHELGCSVYIVKPDDPGEFVDAIRKVGMFLSIIKVPPIGASVEE